MPDAMVTPLVKFILFLRNIIELAITLVCLLFVYLMLQVHIGFYSAYYNTTLRCEILKSVQWARKTYGRLPINVVGHSMGGALASFCALDLSVSTFEPSGSSCVTQTCLIHNSGHFRFYYGILWKYMRNQFSLEPCN